MLNERQRMKAIIKELDISINVLYSNLFSIVALQISQQLRNDTNQIKYEITW